MLSQHRPVLRVIVGTTSLFALSELLKNNSERSLDEARKPLVLPQAKSKMKIKKNPFEQGHSKNTIIGSESQ
jgi:hypothetical protein